MALHSKWTSGDLTFYDGTQDVFTIQDNDEGVTIGEDEGGVDAKFFGGTASAYMLWDADVDDLLFAGGAGLALSGGDILLGDGDYLNFGASKDMTMRWTTGDIFEVLPLAAKSDINLGSATLPVDVKFFGTTGTSEYMQWRSTGHALVFDQADIILRDTDFLNFGDENDITMNWDTGSFDIVPKADNTDMELGSSTLALNVKFFGTTGTTFMQWDSANDKLTFDKADIALGDTDFIKFGDNADITLDWDGASFNIVGTSGNADVELGTANIPLKVKFFGSCGGTDYMQWVSSGSELVFSGSDISMADSDFVKFGADDDITLDWDGDSFNIVGTSGNAYVEFGTASIPLKAKFFGSSGGTASMIWQSSGSKLIFEQSDISIGDTDFIKFGDDDDITIEWDSDSFNIVPSTGNANAPIELGTASYPIRVKFFGTTGTSNYMQWDSSGSELTFSSASIELDGGNITLGDTDGVIFGDGSDFTISVSATDVLQIIPNVDHTDMHFGSTVGDKSIDITWYSSTAADYVYFDSANKLVEFEDVDILLKDNAELRIGSTGTAGDIVMVWNATQLNIIPALDHSDIFFGSSGGSYSLDLKWFGATGADYVLFDSASNLVNFVGVDMEFGDSDHLYFGNDSDYDISYDGTLLSIMPGTTGMDHTDILIGATGGSKSLDVKWLGDAATNYVLLDSTNNLMILEDVDIVLGDDDELRIGSTGTAGDIVIAWDGTELNVIPAADGTDIFLGSSGGAASLDIKWFGATGADYVFFDNANNMVEFEGVDILLKDNAELRIGSTGTVGDMVIKWNATNLSIVPATDHTDMIFGSTVGDKSIDLTYYGSTVSNTMQFSSSGDVVTFAEVDITMATSSQINFRDTNTYINSSAGGNITLTSTGNIYLNGEVTYPDPTTVATTGGLPNITLGVSDNRFQFIDTTGARNVLLPTATGDTAVGIQFFIANASTGANALNVYNGSTGGALIAQIAQYETGILVNDGNIWRGITNTAT